MVIFLQRLCVSRLYNTQGTQSSSVEVAHVLGLIMKLEEKTCENCESDAIEADVHLCGWVYAFVIFNKVTNMTTFRST